MHNVEDENGEAVDRLRAELSDLRRELEETKGGESASVRTHRYVSRPSTPLAPLPARSVDFSVGHPYVC